MEEIYLKYGNEIINYPFPDNSESFSIKEPTFSIEKDFFIYSFQQVLKSAPRDYSKVAIVISDKTRLCGYDIYLPWVLEVLTHNQVKPKDITFYIAYGTHPKQSEEECLASYGESYKKYRFVHHDCSDDQVFTSLGYTERGTEIKVRKDVLESSLIITYGAISHHYFAGFGGGRKLLFPGLAAKEGIYKNHSLFLDFANKKLSPGCQPGNFIGNPVAEDLEEIDKKLPDKLGIHGILDSKGRVCKFMFGKDYNDFVIACNEHHGYYSSGMGQTYEMVVASAGGYPKDINFIQSHKSMHNASQFVKNNGMLILLAECRDGIGNDAFLSLFRNGGWDGIFQSLKIRYAGNGGTALATLAKTRRINVKMVTGLSAENCKLMGAEKISHEQAYQLINGFKGEKAFISNASMLIK